MKDWIEKNYPQDDMTYDKLHRVVREAWEAVRGAEELQKLVQKMCERCQAVIDVDGKPIPFRYHSRVANFVTPRYIYRPRSVGETVAFRHLYHNFDHQPTNPGPIMANQTDSVAQALQSLENHQFRSRRQAAIHYRALD